MKYFLFFIACIVLFYIRHLLDKKIDKEEAEAYSKDSRAEYIRNNFPGVAERICEGTRLTISKENMSSITIGYMQQVAFYLTQDIGHLSVFYFKDGKEMQRWKFDRSTDTNSIIVELKKYF